MEASAKKPLDGSLSTRNGKNHSEVEENQQKKTDALAIAAGTFCGDFLKSKSKIETKT